MRAIASSSAGISLRVGCTWRDTKLNPGSGQAVAAPLGFVRFRQQMVKMGAPLTFRVKLPIECSSSIRLMIRLGCIGSAAMGGRFAKGGIVTSSNPQMCGNKSSWWGFRDVQNVDGVLRDRAGEELAIECDQLPAVTPDGEKLLPGTARATGAHALAAERLIHALSPTSNYGTASEAILRQTYKNCFSLASALELPCLALPALSCGVSGFPAAIGARAAMDAIESHAESALTQANPSAPGLLEFVLLDEDVFAAFADAAHARWGK